MIWLPCVHVFILIQSYMFTFLTGVPHWKMILFMDIVYFLLSYIILSCKIVDSDWLRVNITRWIRKQRPNTWWNLATGDIAWRRVIFQKIWSFLKVKQINTNNVAMFPFPKQSILHVLIICWSCFCRLLTSH